MADGSAARGSISLLLADVDGTLVTEDEVLTEHARGALVACAGSSIAPLFRMNRDWHDVLKASRTMTSSQDRLDRRAGWFGIANHVGTAGRE
jgi:phosphoserine phosphatase